MNFINFIIRSSADPQKVSLMLKGILGAIATLLTVYFGLADISVGSAEINTVVDTIVTVVQNVLLAISGIVAVYGFIRKLYYAKRG